ncbi:MAG TPA: MerC domain-containing protein [Lysobacter sp.]
MPLPDSRLRKADRVGFTASLLCAIHCALLPIALALVPALGLGAGGWVDIDQGFVVFAGLLGVTTMTLGYRRHREFHAWVLLAAGLVLVGLASFTSLHSHSLGHAVLMTIGGLALAGAHLMNLRLTHRAAAA